MSFREIVASSRIYLAAALFVLAAGLGTSPAQATPLAVGSTIIVSYDRPFFLLPDLTGTMALTVESMTAGQIVLGVDVANTTSPWFLTSRLASIGWTTSATPTGANDTSSAYNVALIPASHSIDLTGNRHGSLRPTQSELFTLTLVGNFTSTVDFSNFTAKFQTLIGSFTTVGTVTGATAGSGAGAGAGGGAGSGSVPEPSTLSLFAVALFCSLTYRLARRRAARLIPVKVRS